MVCSLATMMLTKSPWYVLMYPACASISMAPAANPAADLITMTLSSYPDVDGIITGQHSVELLTVVLRGHSEFGNIITGHYGSVPFLLSVTLTLCWCSLITMMLAALVLALATMPSSKSPWCCLNVGTIIRSQHNVVEISPAGYPHTVL